METTFQKLGDAEWPEQWCYYIRSEPTQGGNAHADRVDKGELVTLDRGVLTYSCPCGGKWSRPQGEKIDETRRWIEQHRGHLPVEIKGGKAE